MFPFHCDIGAIITSACDNYNCLGYVNVRGCRLDDRANFTWDWTKVISQPLILPDMKIKLLIFFSLCCLSNQK